MNDSRKILIALAVIFLVGATPALADLDGIWEGYGSGSYELPDGGTLNPWQSWSGTVEKGVFGGSWTDDEGNSGGFTGSIICFYTTNPPTYTFAHCAGTWTWDDPSGLEPVELGTFNMEFNCDLDTCWGNWLPYDGSQGGTMWGWRIGD